MRWWQYLICITVLSVGSIQASFSVLVPMICVNFGLPFSREIEEFTGLSVTKIRKAMKKTIFIWFVINLIALFFFLFFVPMAYSQAYAIGVCLTIFQIGKTRKNKSNIEDFYITYSKFYGGENKEKFDDFFVIKGYLTI